MTCAACNRTPIHKTLLCRAHTRAFIAALEEIMYASLLLPLFKEPAATPQDEQKTKGKRFDPPAPVRLEVISAQDIRSQHSDDTAPVHARLREWETLVIEQRNLAPRPATFIHDCAKALLTHAKWIAAQEFVDDCYLEVIRDRAAMNRLIGDHAPRSIAPCPIVEPEQCEGLLYQDRAGTLAVSCSKCGAVWDTDDLKRLGLLINSPSVLLSEVE